MIPLDLSSLYFRTDRLVRHYEDKALLCVEKDKASPLAEPQYFVYLADLKDGGKVRLIDLPSYAKKHYGEEAVSDNETVIATWPSPPIPNR
jgi:hypothetical protein